MKVSPIVRDVEGSRWDTEGEDEATWWPRVLWVDPGDISGVSAMWFDPAALFAGLPTPRCVLAWQEGYASGDEDEQTQRIIQTVGQLGGPSGLAVGCETFVMQQINMDRSYLSPVRIRSKIEYGLYRGVKEWDGTVRRRSAHGQSASEAKNAITDARLKLWDLYTPGPDHIRDSTKHCLLWLRKLRERGTVHFRKVHGWEDGWFE